MTQGPHEDTATDPGSDPRERARAKLDRGLGMLSAFRDALEETIHEARERGDLSTDRAKDALKGAYRKAREATGDAREKFDFVAQADFDALEARVRKMEDALRSRLGGESTPPEDDSGG